MRCEEAAALLDLYLDDALPEELSGRLDRHLVACSGCAGSLRALEQSRRMLREAVPPAEAAPGFRERAAARLQDQLAEHLRYPAGDAPGRQWILPFSRQEL